MERYNFIRLIIFTLTTATCHASLSQMAGFYSYRERLEAACRSVRPGNVLEWGGGESTLLIAKTCPDARILSIEHSADWYGKLSKRFASNERIELVHLHHSDRPGRAQGYITYPLRRRLEGTGPLEFDLIFVDGRSRCDCLVIAHHVLSETGLVVLHDAERTSYEPGWRLFPHVCHSPESGTIALANCIQVKQRYLEHLDEAAKVRDIS